MNDVPSRIVLKPDPPSARLGGIVDANLTPPITPREREMALLAAGSFSDWQRGLFDRNEQTGENEFFIRTNPEIISLRYLSKAQFESVAEVLNEADIKAHVQMSKSQSRVSGQDVYYLYVPSTGKDEIKLVDKVTSVIQDALDKLDGALPPAPVAETSAQILVKSGRAPNVSR